MPTLTTMTPTTTQTPGRADQPAIAASALNLTKVYGDGPTAVRAVDQLSVNLYRGTFTAIVGPSGSGKSSLMHCLAGLDTVTSGHVFLAGQDLTVLSDRQLTRLRRDQVGFVFQQFNLLPALTAEQNILLPLELANRTVDRRHLSAIVTSLGLADRLTHKPAELSGGQQQRVAIARALITEPAVIFADEPTGALDSVTGQQLLDYLRRCVDELSQTIVMVTHDPRAAGYADRVLVLADGRLVDELERPTPQAVLTALAHLGAAAGADAAGAAGGRAALGTDR